MPPTASMTARVAQAAPRARIGSICRPSARRRSTPVTSPAPRSAAPRLPAPRQGLLARLRATWQSRPAGAYESLEQPHPLSDVGFVRLPDPARPRQAI